MFTGGWLLIVLYISQIVVLMLSYPCETPAILFASAFAVNVIDITQMLCVKRVHSLRDVNKNFFVILITSEFEFRTC